MITGRKTEKIRVEVGFQLPMNARDIHDAIFQIESMFATEYDDKYWIKSDGEELIFYWEKD